MPFFTDNADRSWRVAITYDDVVRVREAIGVDLLAPHQQASSDESLARRLITDDALLVNVLFLAIGPAAIRRGLDDRAFGRSMRRRPRRPWRCAIDPLEPARIAFFESWADFFPRKEDSDAGDDEDDGSPRDKPDIETLIWELAGVAGVDPRPFTLRQLHRLSRGYSRQAWQHTSSLMALVKSAATGKAVKPIELDPFARARGRQDRKKKGGRRGLPFRLLIEALADAKARRQQGHSNL